MLKAWIPHQCEAAVLIGQAYTPSPEPDEAHGCANQPRLVGPEASLYWLVLDHMQVGLGQNLSLQEVPEDADLRWKLLVGARGDGARIGFASLVPVAFTGEVA